MQGTTHQTQQIMRLLWVGLAGLTGHLSVAAQANAYWEQRQCTWSATLGWHRARDAESSLGFRAHGTHCQNVNAGDLLSVVINKP